MACILLLRHNGVPNIMRVISRRFINPPVLRWAGKRCSPHAVIYHVGRRSGRLYRTPVVALPTAGGFIITLTYGTKTDWYRNMQAMPQTRLRWHGRDYMVTAPEIVDAQRAATVLPPLMRFLTWLIGIRTYIEVKRLNVYR
jgi:deazaflavin-dependent oxidoreductase (nitroreductase family)